MNRKAIELERMNSLKMPVTNRIIKAMKEWEEDMLPDRNGNVLRHTKPDTLKIGHLLLIKLLEEHKGILDYACPIRGKVDTFLGLKIVEQPYLEQTGNIDSDYFCVSYSGWR